MTDDVTVPNSRSHRWRRRIAITLSTIAVLAVGAYWTLRWFTFLPGPSGPHHVGQTTLVFTDGERVDPWTGKSPRVVLAYVFYPTNEQGEKADYFPHLGELAENFEDADAYLIRIVPHLMSASAREEVNASSDLGPLPTLLFSPGVGTPIFLYRSLLEDLASHGYVVMGIEPTYEGVGQVLPDGRVMEPLSNNKEPADDASPEVRKDFYEQRATLRVADLSFVIDQVISLSDKDSLPANLNIATDRFGVFGHSIGGVAAAEAARRDGRIRAAVNLDGLTSWYPYLEEQLPEGKGASLFFLGKRPRDPSDHALQQMGKSREVWNAERDDRFAQRSVDLSEKYGEIRWVELDETAHDDFSDVPFFYPQTDDHASKRLARIRSELLQYFGHRLHDTSSADL